MYIQTTQFWPLILTFNYYDNIHVSDGTQDSAIVGKIIS